MISRKTTKIDLCGCPKFGVGRKCEANYVSARLHVHHLTQDGVRSLPYR